MAGTEHSGPSSESGYDVSQLILTLVQETRDDVRVLVQESARAQARLDALERRADAIDKRLETGVPSPSKTRDAGIAGGAAALVVAVFQILAAMGWMPAQGAPVVPPPAPPAITAAP